MTTKVSATEEALQRSCAGLNRLADCLERILAVLAARGDADLCEEVLAIMASRHQSVRIAVEDLDFGDAVH